MFNEYPERFEKTEGGIKKLADMALVNMLPQTILSHYILRQMIPRKKGIIVNISSTINYFEWYYLAVYSASKRYARWLSAILQAEYKGTGITIQTVCPGVVATNMTKNPKPSFTEPTPLKFVGQAIHSIGLIKETTGCFAHQLNVSFDHFDIFLGFRHFEIFLVFDILKYFCGFRHFDIFLAFRHFVPFFGF
ncbi:unnamed protein product [Meloidogyne enterolobii]|uniref:Uncharacterized protein n=1 Tax=Meloidogyne enterolobii TaxID=390850 RepID=A0ACB0YK78_MELEN